MTSSAYRASQTFCIFQNPLQAEVQRALALHSQESIFSHQFHLQHIRIVVETSCLVSFFCTTCVLQTTLYFLKAPNAPVDNEFDTNRYLFFASRKMVTFARHFLEWTHPFKHDFRMETSRFFNASTANVSVLNPHSQRRI